MERNLFWPCEASSTFQFVGYFCLAQQRMQGITTLHKSIFRIEFILYTTKIEKGNEKKEEITESTQLK